MVIDRMPVSRTRPPFPIAPRWPLLATLALSLALHSGVLFLMAEFLVMPALDIEFQLPMDVEFGMTEQVEVDPAALGQGAPEESDPAGSTKVEGETSAEAPPKPAPKPKKAPKPVAPVSAGSDEVSRLPAGTQIAVRVDMKRIRQSPLADDVRQLLAAIPDWQALLEGSDINPVEQLDRFMIATPNLQRSKIVVAGRYVGGEQVVFEAVEKLARAQGTTASFQVQHGVRVAPWANRDATPRVIALVGPEHFTISREEDLVRVLAVAAARAGEKKGALPADANAEHPADALLSMEENEGLSVEVEGAEQFVRRASRGVPEKLRLAAVERPGLLLELRGRLTFADADKAADAALFWDNLRTTYGRNMLVSILGLAEPLKAGTIETKDTQVLLTVTLRVEQAQLILGYLRELVRPAPAPVPSNLAQPAPTAPQKSP